RMRVHGSPPLVPLEPCFQANAQPMLGIRGPGHGAVSRFEPNLRAVPERGVEPRQRTGPQLRDRHDPLLAEGPCLQLLVAPMAPQPQADALVDPPADLERGGAILPKPPRVGAREHVAVEIVFVEESMAILREEGDVGMWRDVHAERHAHRHAAAGVVPDRCTAPWLALETQPMPRDLQIPVLHIRRRGHPEPPQRGEVLTEREREARMGGTGRGPQIQASADRPPWLEPARVPHHARRFVAYAQPAELVGLRVGPRVGILVAWTVVARP